MNQRLPAPVATNVGGAAIHVREADMGLGAATVLRHVTLEVAHGDRILVHGDNGSGKSTLLDTLAGLAPAKRGSVRVLGLDPLHERQAVHRRIGQLGHVDPFYPELTGRENLRFHADLRGLPAAAVDAELAQSGLGDAADQLVARYSRGMRRRLGIAKAFLGKPELLLLDEPDAGLDAAARRALATRLQARAVTALVVTHHAEDYAGWATRSIRLERGALVREAVAAP